MTLEPSPAPATLDDVLAVARRRRISPNGCLPNQSEPRDVPTPGSDWCESHLPMVETCRRFIRAADRPNFGRAQSSYHLKHEVERWRRDVADADTRAVTTSYVTNGSFLVACLLEGIEPRRVRVVPPTMNARITLPKVRAGVAA